MEDKSVYIVQGGDLVESEKVITEYGKRKRLRGWAVFVAAILVIFLVSLDLRSPWIAGLLGGGLVMGAWFFDRLVWRCPACNTPLGRDRDYQFCPHCSVRLH